MNHRDRNHSGSDKQRTSGKGKSDLQGAPLKSNRQTGGHEKDDSGKGPEKNTTKKQSNAI